MIKPFYRDITRYVPGAVAARLNAYHEQGLRIAIVELNLLTFGVPINATRTLLFAYEQNNFCIEPPDLPLTVPTLWDKIGTVKHVSAPSARPPRATDTVLLTDYPQLSADEQLVAQFLPNGWGLHTYDEWRPGHIPARLLRRARTHSLYRLNAALPIPCALWPRPKRLLHPTQPRPLTFAELCAVTGHDPAHGYAEKYTYSAVAKALPLAAADWAQYMCDMCESGYWGGEDWSSSFDARDLTWKANECAVGTTLKRFDMREYVPREYRSFHVPSGYKL